MESNSNQCNENYKGNIEVKRSFVKTHHGTVTTLYYNCDNSIFNSSDSSVQIACDSNYNATIGHDKQNFCNLITKNTNAGSENSKQINQKVVQEESSDYIVCMPMLLVQVQCVDENTGKTKVDKMCQTKKRRSSSSRGCKAGIISQPKQLEELTPSHNTESIFFELDKAKTMYFVELPYTSPFTEQINNTIEIETKTDHQPKIPEEFTPSQINQSKFAELDIAKTMYFVELPNSSLSTDQESKSIEIERSVTVQKYDINGHESSELAEANVQTEFNKKSNEKESLGDSFINNIDSNELLLNSSDSATTLPLQILETNPDISSGTAIDSKPTKMNFREIFKKMQNGYYALQRKTSEKPPVISKT